MELAKLLTDYLVPFCAIAAFILSLLNFYFRFYDSKEHLIITPKRLMAYEQPDGFVIEVFNNSKFPVYIAEIGLTLGGTTINSVRCPFTRDNEEYPKRLEAREQCHVIATAMSLKDHWCNLESAYAKTSSSKVTYGNSDALKQMNAQLKMGNAPCTKRFQNHKIRPGEVVGTAEQV